MAQFNEEYHRHISNTHQDHKGKSLCGVKVIGWAYVDVDHAFFSAQSDYIQPCPDCAKIVAKVFTECE